MKEEINQELIFKLNLFEQQIQQIQEQIQAIDQAILDSNTLCSGLDELKNSEGKEIFSSVGKGIFLKSKIISESLLIDVGGKNLVKKSVPETQSIIKDQLKKLEQVKKELEEKTQEINEELTKTFMEIQGKEE